MARNHLERTRIRLIRLFRGWDRVGCPICMCWTHGIYLRVMSHRCQNSIINLLKSWWWTKLVETRKERHSESERERHDSQIRRKKQINLPISTTSSQKNSSWILTLFHLSQAELNWSNVWTPLRKARKQQQKNALNTQHTKRESKRNGHFIYSLEFLFCIFIRGGGGTSHGPQMPRRHLFVERSCTTQNQNNNKIVV
jgi:hypothetical protein